MAIGDVTSTGTLNQAYSSPLQTYEKPVQTTKESDSSDHVKISASAQIKTMYTSGHSVQQIANSLGLSKNTVDEYLGITTAAEKALLSAAAK